ncbi:MAG: helix-turn-helix transcriptional regulator [Anaerolineales bacterium]|nr:helix-turn-helix transcriptional regulator [Anaerolineales bacterium]
MSIDEYTVKPKEYALPLKIGLYSKMDKMSFSEWLSAEMQKRDWSQSDLARASGLRRATISNVLNRVRQPGTAVLHALARGLDLPLDLVYRKAGLLPTRAEPTDAELRWLHIFEKATDKERAELLERAEIELARLKEKRKRTP